MTDNISHAQGRLQLRAYRRRGPSDRCCAGVPTGERTTSSTETRCPSTCGWRRSRVLLEHPVPSNKERNLTTPIYGHRIDRGGDAHRHHPDAPERELPASDGTSPLIEQGLLHEREAKPHGELATFGAVTPAVPMPPGGFSKQTCGEVADVLSPMSLGPNLRGFCSSEEQRRLQAEQHRQRGQ